jgi:GNAT superfamily N-acetyltransferase
MILQVTAERMGLLYEIRFHIDGQKKDARDLWREVEKFTNRDDHAAYIFVEADRPLGYIEFCLHEKFPPPGSPALPILERLGHIARIGVHADARKNGIGKRLLEAAEHWMMYAGLPGVWLGYIPSEPREHLYAKYEKLAEYMCPKKHKLKRIVAKRWS